MNEVEFCAGPASEEGVAGYTMIHARIGALAMASALWAVVGSRAAAQSSDKEWNQLFLASLLDSGARFGSGLASLGDLDGDGEQEVAIGAPLAWGEAGRTGAVLIVSLPSWKQVRRIDGARHGSSFGEELRAIRLDPKAKTPLLAVSGSLRELIFDQASLSTPRSAALVDPATGKTVRELPGIFHVLGMQHDADGDGVRELVVEGLRADGWRIETLSGANGTPIMGRSFAFKAQLLELDFDGDGALDFLREPRAGQSELELVSGADGKRLAGLPTPVPRPVTPWRLEAASLDLDGDRASDVALHWPLDAKGVSEIVLFQGPKLEHRRSLVGTRGEEANSLRFDLDYQQLAPGPDFTADGIDEVLVLGDWVDLSCYSGADRVRIWSAKFENSWGVQVVAEVHDVDGDGVSDLLCGSPERPHSYSTQKRVAAVTLLSGKTGKLIDARTDESYLELSFRFRKELQEKVAEKGEGALKELNVAASELKVSDVEEPKATLFGLSIAALGDIDGDGEDEVAIGAPKAWDELGRPGAVLIVSVASRRLHRILWGKHDSDWFGDRVQALRIDPNAKYALVGIDRAGVFDPVSGACVFETRSAAIQGLQNDLDGDGLREVVAGHTYSTRSGKPLEIANSEALRLVEIDFDGDGFFDMLRPPERGDARIALVSGINQRELVRMALPEPYRDYSSFFACLAADVEGDERREIVITLPNIDDGNSQLIVFSGNQLERTRSVPVVTKKWPDGMNSDLPRRELHRCGDLDGDGSEDLLAAAYDFMDQSLTCYSGAGGTPNWIAERAVDATPSSATSTSDLDGDGTREVLSGVVTYLHGFGPPQYGPDGTVQVRSGKTGKLLDVIEEREFPQISFERHLQSRKR